MSNCIEMLPQSTPARIGRPAEKLALAMPAAGRIEWLDVLRGIASFLVIVRHSTLSVDSWNIAPRWLHALGLPLFFVISGVFMNPARHPRFSTFLRSRFRSILVPYFGFAVWTCVLLGPLHASQGESVWGYFRHVAAGVGRGTGFVLPEWFLPCLFVTHIYAFLLIKAVGGTARILAVSTAVAVVGIALSMAGLKCVYWGVSAATVGGFFVAMGYAIRPWVFQPATRPARSMGRAGLIVVLYLASFGVAMVDPVKTDLMIGQLRPNLLVAGLTGVLASILLAQMIFHNKCLAYLGRNSLAIMYFSVIIPFVCNMACKTMQSVLPGWVLAIHAWGPSRKLLYLLMLVAVIGLVNRWLPWTLGKRSRPRQAGQDKIAGNHIPRQPLTLVGKA